MTCEEAKRLVIPYINGSITDEELKGLSKHIETYEECQEELGIYFIVDVGTRQLGQETGIYGIREALETTLELSRQRVHTPGILETVRHAMNTLYLWAALAVLVLQFKV